ncbi:prolyl oligopeptidase family serine peptidase, partial [Pseudoalteromonas nigrifaciens]|uniref:prolyl oligopeptidase family serine peptidase n=1 Tax=Pseudoalteromonas nigrifaciens TaxID=28109 RepID=UPI003569ED3F
MFKQTLACAVLVALSGCSEPTNTATNKEVKAPMSQANSVSYPVTKKGEVVDSYFGETLADPYRWLEDDMSAETASWVKAQNKVTFSYLEQIPYRDKLKQRLEKLMNYEKIGAPFTEGDYTYFYKNDGLQNQYVLYRSKEGGDVEVFLDPNKFSDDGTTSMSGLSFSKDGSLLAYQISEGGSDWRKIIIIDTQTKEQVEQALVDVKFSGIDWLGNEGFYYSSYDKPEGSELSAKTDQHKVYYHTLGSDQATDKLVFGATDEQKHRYVGADVTHDGRYLLISASTSTSGNKLFIKDLTQKDSEFVTIVGNTDSDTSVIDNEGSKLFLVTNLNAPNQKVVTVDAADPGPQNWQDFIPETKNVLKLTKGGDTFFANYMVDAISKVKQYNKKGELIRDITLPGVGTAGGFSGKKEQTTLYYSFTNYKTPGTTYTFDVTTGESGVYRKSGVDFNSDDYTSEQVFYNSKDGTKVPMIITYKNGIKLDGSNPTILYGYGGFNISLTPSFSPTTAAWLEQGGVYAVANIRGGGEYGKEWHNAGTKLQKQNVFDDFIAAAEYLQSKKYTSKQRLALRGGSNGGLLVGAVMTQRP